MKRKRKNHQKCNLLIVVVLICSLLAPSFTFMEVQAETIEAMELGEQRSSTKMYDPLSNELDISNVFEAGATSKYSYGYRIPGIVVTNQDTLLAYTEARNGSSDWAPMDLVLKRSTDGGNNWSDEQIIFPGVTNGKAINNPVIFVGKDNIIHMIYCVEYGVVARGGGVYYIQSRDDGVTWSERTDISASFYTDEFKRNVVATGPGHGIVLEDGTLLVPIWMASGADGSTAHQPSVVSTIYSKDNGATWEMGEVIFANGQMPNPNETVAIQLKDGSVMLNMRTQTGLKRRAVSISKTGYSGWSKPTFDDALVDNGCFGSITRYDDETILFVNANSTGARMNGTVRASYDEGKTWAVSRVIDPENYAYSDIAVDSKKTIYVLFEKGPSLKLARFTKQWMEEANNGLLKTLSTKDGKFTESFVPSKLAYNMEIEPGKKEVTLDFTSYKSDAVIKVNGEVNTQGSYKQVITQPRHVMEITVEVAGTTTTYQITINQKVKDNSLVAYYNFDQLEGGKYTDQSIYGNNLTNTGSTLVEGKYGQAAQFTNATDYAQVDGTNGLSFKTNDFTATMWLKPSDISGTRFIQWYGTAQTNAKQWWLRSDGGKLQLCLSGGGEKIIATPAAVLKTNQWQHVAIQRAGSTVRLFVDGVKVAENIDVPVYDVNGDDILRIGKEKSGAVRPYKGGMDEMRFYNSALTVEEITNLYGLQTPSIASWNATKLNEVFTIANGDASGLSEADRILLETLKSEISVLLEKNTNTPELLTQKVLDDKVAQATTFLRDKGMIKDEEVTIVGTALAGYSSVKISFAKITGIGTYDIYRSNSENGTYTKIGTTETTNFVDATGAGRKYFYKVKSQDGSKVSGAFTSAKATGIESMKENAVLFEDTSKVAFTGANLVDVSSKASDVAKLANGSLLIKFKTTDKSGELALLVGKTKDDSVSITNSAHNKAAAYLRKSGEQMVYRADFKHVRAQTTGTDYADGQWHTAMFTQADSGEVFRFAIDGVDKGSFTDERYKGFFSTMVNMNELTIGGYYNGNTTTVSNGFKGEIAYVAIIDENISKTESLSITAKESGVFGDLISQMFTDGKDNTWVFSGGADVQGSFGQTEGARNYIGHFEEYIRYIKAGSVMGRQRYTINTGKEGNSIKTVNEEFGNLVAKYDPKALAVFVGEEDFTAGLAGIAEFKVTLSELVDKALSLRNKEGLLVIQTPYAQGDTEKNTQAQAYVAAVQEVYDAMAPELKERVKVVNHFAQTNNDTFKTTKLNADGHLNKLGHYEITKQFTTATYGSLDGFPVSNGNFNLQKVKKTENYLTTAPTVVASDTSLTVTIPQTVQTPAGAWNYELNLGTQTMSGTFVNNTATMNGLTTDSKYTLVVTSTDGNTKLATVTGTVKAQDTCAVKPVTQTELNALQQQIKAVVDKKEPATWLFVGDSITHGCQHTYGYQSYSQLFEQYVKVELGRKDDIVINVAVSGSTTKEQEANSNERLDKYDADVVYVMLGTNDANPGKGISVEEYRTKLASIIDKVKAKGAVPVLATPNPLRDPANVQTSNLIALSEIIRETAAVKNALLVDHEASWKKALETRGYLWNNGYWNNDFLHPGASGHVVMAQNIIKTMGLSNETSTICNLEYKMPNTDENSNVEISATTAAKQIVVDMQNLERNYGSTIGSATMKAVCDGITYTTTAANGDNALVLRNLPTSKTYEVTVTANLLETSKTVTFKAQSVRVNEPTAQCYNVQFLGKDGQVIKEETVEKGQSATAPTAPVVSGYTFVRWDKEFHNVQGNLEVNAVYVKNEELKPELSLSGMTVTAGSEEASEPARNAIDGNTSTIWHTRWAGADRKLHHITLDMKNTYDINGFVGTPRSNAGTAYANGVITKYELQVSMNGTDFTTIAKGNWTNTTGKKQATILATIPARYVRLVSKESFSDTPGKLYSSLAELGVLGVEHVLTVDKTQGVAKAIEDIIPKGEYSNISYNAYIEARSALNMTVIKTDATQGEVDSAVAAYNTAVNELAVEKPVTGVTLDKKTASVNAGATVTLKVTVTPADATNQLVTWTSSNTEVATVNAQGVVTAVKAGTATITASAGGKNATCVITVKAIPVEVDKTQLKAAIDTAKALEESKYTEASFGLLIKAIVAAEAVYADADANAKEVEDATIELQEAVNNLEEKQEEVKNGWIKEAAGYRYYENNIAVANKWIKNKNTWMYAGKDGYRVYNWKKVSNAWYYFDQNGIMKTDWQKIGGTWYYLATSGKMLTGWQKVRNQWYYLAGSGAMKTGWLKESGTWYYLNTSGKMLTGWQKVNNQWYYLNASGKMQTGWQKIKNQWYYLNTSGKMQTGWVKVKGVWYYLKASGAMATGWTFDGRRTYYLSPSTGVWNGQVK